MTYGLVRERGREQPRARVEDLTARASGVNYVKKIKIITSAISAQAHAYVCVCVGIRRYRLNGSRVA